MITLVLFLHISLAVVSLVFAGGVIQDSRKQLLERMMKRTKAMWYGTISTVASGVILTIATGSSIGRLCGTLFIFLAVVSLAHAYQRKVRQQFANS